MAHRHHISWQAALVGLVLVTSSVATVAQESITRGSELNENAWDFNAPVSAPGFGPMTQAEARALLQFVSR